MKRARDLTKASRVTFVVYRYYSGLYGWQATLGGKVVATLPVFAGYSRKADARRAAERFIAGVQFAAVIEEA